jgi:hypothetical protein
MQIFIQISLSRKILQIIQLIIIDIKRKKKLRKYDFRKYAQVRFRSCNFKIYQKNIMKIRKPKNISTKKNLQ